MSWSQRADRAEEYFRDEIQCTISVTETLRSAGSTPIRPGCPVHQPRYTGALFPTLDNVYDGFYVQLEPVRRFGCAAGRRRRGSGRSSSTTVGSTPRTSRTPLLSDRCRHRPRRRRRLRGDPRSRRSGTPELDRHRRAPGRDLRDPLPTARATRTADGRGHHRRPLIVGSEVVAVVDGPADRTSGRIHDVIADTQPLFVAERLLQRVDQRLALTRRGGEDDGQPSRNSCSSFGSRLIRHQMMGSFCWIEDMIC